MSVIEYIINEDSSYIDLIENEFVFSAMRSRIDNLLKENKLKQDKIESQERENIEEIKNTRKNWFGRQKNVEEVSETNENSILYNDIDMTRTGFRNEEEN